MQSSHSSRYNCVTTITCNRPPWRWPVFCVSISYVTSQPKGQKLMEDEMACDFLPPTTVTVPQTHCNTHAHTQTHACCVKSGTPQRSVGATAIASLMCTLEQENLTLFSYVKASTQPK